MGSRDDDSMFYHHICHFCKSSPEEPSDKFKKCSSCKLISYCSTEHQKSDWKRHKPFCLAVKHILARMQTDSLYSNDGDPMDSDTLYRYQCSVLKLLEMTLKRNLNGVEQLSIIYADLCGHCYRPNVIRVPCPNCNVEHYCSELHREEHAPIHVKDCANLNLCFALDLCATLTHGVPKESLKIDGNTISNEPFSAHMIEFLKEFAPEKMTEYDRLLMSDVLSYSLSLLYALKLAKSGDFKGKTHISVHVIGAEELEALMVKVMDPLFSWHPNLKSISISLIGPEAPHSVSTITGGTKLIEVMCWPELYYHDFTKKSSYSKPDVAVAFNCGLHEFDGSEKDTWKDTIVELAGLSRGTLLVFTSYTKKESEKDSELVKKVDTQGRLNLLRCSVNPYASLKPNRNPERGETSTFFFNNYLTVFEIQ